jgi:dihydroxyacid dehydratase/phosphogluconate dehydratase
MCSDDWRQLYFREANIHPSMINSFENAMRVGMAVGRSTNMVLHFIVMAKEAGLLFDTFDRLSPYDAQHW